MASCQSGTAAFLSRAARQTPLCRGAEKTSVIHPYLKTAAAAAAASSPPFFRALVHATALPLSLLIPSQTRHCPRPIMTVLHCCVPRTFWPGRMLTHCPARPKSDLLFGPLTRNAHAASPWYPAHNCARARTHTRPILPAKERRVKVASAITGSDLFQPPPPTQASRKSLRTGCN